MHKLYNVHNKSEITLGSKQWKILQTSGINFTLQDPTDWLITSLTLLLMFGGNSKSQSMSNSTSIATRFYSSHNLMINVT